MSVESMLCALLGVVAFAVAYRLLTRAGPPIDERPLALCPSCGYDLRYSTEICPECGAAVAEDRRLRADLLENRFPAWMLEASSALPLREADPAEPWRAVAAVGRMRQVPPLLSLLERGGIDHRSELVLAHGSSNVLGIPKDATSLLAVIEVPERDWPIAHELALFVRWTDAADQLDALVERLGIEPDEDPEGHEASGAA